MIKSLVVSGAEYHMKFINEQHKRVAEEVQAAVKQCQVIKLSTECMIDLATQLVNKPTTPIRARPPFRFTLIEFETIPDGNYLGILLRERSEEHSRIDLLSYLPKRKILHCIPIYAKFRHDMPALTIHRIGNYTEWEQAGEDYPLLRKHVVSKGNIALHILRLLNCRNVSLADRQDRVKHPKRNKKNSRKKKSPVMTVTYKVLMLELTKKQQENLGSPTAKVEFGTYGTGIHMGHEKTYKKDPITGKGGLFGKLEGTWWWHETVKGTDENHLIEKQYLVTKT